MGTHAARFPGLVNDLSKEVLSKRQASRLAAAAHVPASMLEGQTLAAIRAVHDLRIDPAWLRPTRVCGRVVKTDGEGVDRPVPFATVKVYDTDLGLLGWSPVESRYTWFFPLRVRKELLRTVTTDECGRFCVDVPRWEIDFYVRWRLERQCYLTWLRRPTIRDMLADAEVIPPSPGPLHVDEHLVTHAGRVLDASAVAHLRTLTTQRLGDPVAKLDAVLDRPALPRAVRPPLDAAAKALLAPAGRRALAARAGVSPALLEQLDSRRFLGPFLRCRTIVVPQWKVVSDIPDLTFEVTQDINGDGTQEVIYSEGLLDVRWNAGALPDVTLHAGPLAVASEACGSPNLPPNPNPKAPAILLAGYYPLRQPAPAPPDQDASEFQDEAGYALLPNPPDADQNPVTPHAGTAQAPFIGSFYLYGDAEIAGATHYRIAHVVNGVTGYLNKGFRLFKSTPLQWLDVRPVDGQWYRIVPRSLGWTPGGILAPVGVAGNARHGFRIELGIADSAGKIAPVPNGASGLYQVHIDTEPPAIAELALAWRQPDTDLSWKDLDVENCPRVIRGTSGRVQFRLRAKISANHLRDYSVTAEGCGPAASPVLITEARDGLAITSAASHWYMAPDDNTANVELYYELKGGAPAGCYRFDVGARSRAFNPTTTVDLDTLQQYEDFWRATEQAPVHALVARSVAVQ